MVSLASGPVTRFDRYSLENGLSQATITSIVQDSQGFLWFATEDGLNRYDGYTFKVFRHDPQDPGSISNNRINTLYKDSNDRLWIGTHGGLNRFDVSSERFVHFKHHVSNPHSLSHNNVSSIFEDKDGVFWVGTHGGLNRFDGSSQKFTHFKYKVGDHDSLSHDHVQAIHQDAKGILWIGTDNGLNRRDTEQQGFSHYFHQPSAPHSLSHNAIKSILEDSHGTLWIGTDAGLDRFDSKKQHFVSFTHQNNAPHSLSQGVVNALFEDSKGTLWIGTDGGGLNRYNAARQSFIHLTHDNADPHSLSNNIIRSIHEDSQGALWIGTYAGGLNKIDRQRQRFGHFKRQASNPYSLSHSNIRPIHEDGKGTLWIGSDDGLNYFDIDTQRFIYFKHQAADPRSLSHNRIRAIHEDSTGTLWIGTLSGGLNQYNPQTRDFIHFKHQPSDPHSLSHNSVYAIHEDSRGTLWIGTMGGGLNRFDRQTGTFVHYRHQRSNPQSLSDDGIYTIYEDSSKRLWIGTFDGGLNRFDSQTGHFEHYRHQPSSPDSLSNDAVSSIYEDTRGTLWIGTLGGGLNKFDGQDFTHYKVKNGLPNNVVYGILEDHQGQLWLSTNKGLSRFNPTTETFSNYDVNDGLQSNEFNGGAYFKSRSGELFFGGINGFNRFFAENIQHDTQPPSVVLTDFLLANQSVSIQNHSRQSGFTLPKAINALKQLTLNHQQNFFSFEFAALHFANPMQNQYAYQLKGWDEDWFFTDAGNRRATYTNLPPGEHTLRIKASNSDGYWNRQGKSLKITVLPPLWKTWWAYSIYALLLTTLAFALVHTQRRKIRDEHALNLRLEHKVSERTAALEQKNHEIIATQQQLLQAEKMASLGTLTAGVAHEINNPTNFVHVSVYNLEVDLQRCQQFIIDLAGDNADEAILEQFRLHFDPLHQHLSTIKNGSERIKGIVEDLRSFSQLGTAEQSTVTITDLLQSTINLVQTQYFEVAEFITDFQDKPQLLCYPAQLNQVFMNLLVNACDAIDEKQQQQTTKIRGKIIITCQLPGNGSEQQLRISIKDNGCGMTTQTKNKLFEPFYSTKEVRGTGLGLSISYGIVQQHQGTLSVTSDLGVGTVFTLYLPLISTDLVVKPLTESM